MTTSSLIKPLCSIDPIRYLLGLLLGDGCEASNDNTLVSRLRRFSFMEQLAT